MIEKTNSIISFETFKFYPTKEIVERERKIVSSAARHMILIRRNLAKLIRILRQI